MHGTNYLAPTDADVYSEPFQTFKLKHFAKIIIVVNYFRKTL